MKVSYLKHILESNFTHILFSRQQHRGRWTSHQSHLFPLPMIRATYFASLFNLFLFRLGTHYLFTIDALIHCLRLSKDKMLHLPFRRLCLSPISVLIGTEISRGTISIHAHPKNTHLTKETWRSTVSTVPFNTTRHLQDCL